MNAGLVERITAAGLPSVAQKIQKKQRIQDDVSRFTSASSSSFLKSTSIGSMKHSGTLNSFWKPIERQEVDDAWAPSSEALRTTLLERSKGRVTRKLDVIKASWKATGCTVLSDGWSDICQRPLINVLLASPEGVVFLNVIDTSDQKKTSAYIF